MSTPIAPHIIAAKLTSHMLQSIHIPAPTPDQIPELKRGMFWNLPRSRLGVSLHVRRSRFDRRMVFYTIRIYTMHDHLLDELVIGTDLELVHRQAETIQRGSGAWITNPSRKKATARVDKMMAAGNSYLHQYDMGGKRMNEFMEKRDNRSRKMPR